MEKQLPIKIYTAGGTLSQFCALVTGLYIKKFTGRDFVLSYVHSEMDHTSGFVLEPILGSNSFEIILDPITIMQTPRSGRILSRFPKQFHFYFALPKFLYGTIMKLRYHMIRYLRNLRAEHISLTSFGDLRSLKRISPRTLTINGNYWPGLIKNVINELENLFKDSLLPHIFREELTLIEDVCIHYRLGDMRTDKGSKITHGVIDPKQLLKIYSDLCVREGRNLNVVVFSDEPRIARILLEDAGAENWSFQEKNEIWKDVDHMISFRYFIGSYSTVSFVVAAIRYAKYELESVLPRNSRKNRISRLQPGCRYFRAKILKIEHYAYSIES